MTSVARSADCPEQTSLWSAPSALAASAAVVGTPPQGQPERSPGDASGVSGLRRENSRSGLLLTSLQRVYRTGDAPSPQPAGPSPESAATSTSDAARQLAIGLIETVFEVGDLDPFPFVNRRDDSVEIESKSKLPVSATLSAGASPTDAEEASSVPGHVAVAKPQGPMSSADRRKLPRRDSDCSVLVSPYAGDERLSPERTSWIIRAAKTRGHLVDVSMSGVAVHLSEEVAAGTRIVMRISNRTLSKHLDASATVLRCRRDGETGWNVVCRFDKNLTFEQIHLIGRNLFAYTIV